MSKLTSMKLLAALNVVLNCVDATVSTDTEILYEGFMIKRGSGKGLIGRKNWLKRWHVLIQHGETFYLTYSDIKGTFQGFQGDWSSALRDRRTKNLIEIRSNSAAYLVDGSCPYHYITKPRKAVEIEVRKKDNVIEAMDRTIVFDEILSGSKKNTERRFECKTKEDADAWLLLLLSAYDNAQTPVHADDAIERRRLVTLPSSILSTIVVTLVSLLMWYLFLRGPSSQVKSRRRTTIIKKRPTFVKGKRKASRRPTLSTLRSEGNLVN